MKFITKAAKLVIINGEGQYGQVILRDYLGERIKCFRWNLEEAQIKPLKSKFHFVRLAILRERLYIRDVVEIPELTLEILEARAEAQKNL